MCGHLGLIQKEGSLDVSKFSKSLKLINYRGPDDSRTWIDKNNPIIFGFNRLSIIDLSDNGNQPMHDYENNYIIVFNGEIYNFKEIKEELLNAGYEFKSNSDTEVVLMSYIHWGKEHVKKLKGMFSYCIYDKLESKCLLFRDFSGEKPLYYFFDKDKFIFCSEIEPILNQIDEIMLDKEALQSHLKFSFSGLSKTLFKNILKLKAGNYMELNLNSWEILIKEFANRKFKLNSSNPNLANLVRELEDLLERSVHERLIADVKVGVLLSGGLDSSIITAFASRIDPSLITFSAVFNEDAKVSEKVHSNKIAEYFNTNHKELHIGDISPHTFESIISKSFDPPGPSFIPTFLISELVSKHTKAVLGGDGADELFGGYYNYLNTNKFRYLNSILFSRPFYYFSRCLYNLNISNKYSRNLFHLIFYSIPLFRNSLVPWSDFNQRNLLLDSNYNLKDTFKKNYLSPSNSITESALLGDFNLYLTEDVLRKVDLASMQNSLEVRAPFLDKEIINFAYNKVPSKFKVAKGKGKIILNELGRRHLPKDFHFYRKQGFSFPLSYYFSKKEWKDHFQTTIQNTRAPINKEYAISLLNALKTKSKNSSFFYLIISFIILYDQVESKYTLVK